MSCWKRRGRPAGIGRWALLIDEAGAPRLIGRGGVRLRCRGEGLHGAGYRTRTDDLLFTRQLLYQLS